MSGPAVIFMSIGFPDEADKRYPELDKVGMRELIHALANGAEAGHCIVVVRDHPAIAPMLEYRLKHKPGSLIVVPEDKGAAAIARAHPLAAAIFLGGDAGTIDDFNRLGANRNLILMPLPGTGGAAALIDAEQKARGTVPAIARNIRHEDPYGFDRLHRLIDAVAHRPPPKTPGLQP